ncbi:hypothetical protein, partial [Mesorhizobium sp. M0159]|uniref:hypothetical protein n=1 Tax=Mesorhizobium sp. M0159 TaxID=2956900 RepID=UPI00333CA756
SGDASWSWGMTMSLYSSGIGSSGNAARHPGTPAGRICFKVTALKKEALSIDWGLMSGFDSDAVPPGSSK